MIFRVFADAVVIVHLAFVVFAVFGGLLTLRWRKTAWLHLPAACWAATIEFCGWICPLTPLEIWLRVQGGASGYSEGFVEHYMVPILYPPGLTAGIQIALGVGIVVFNLALYWFAFRIRAKGSG